MEVRRDSSVKLEILQKNQSVSLFRTYLATFSAHLYTIVLGMVETYSAPATVDIKKKGSRFFNITDDQITWIASLPIFVCGIGCLSAGYLTHKFGRKTTLLLISPAYVLSWLMVAYAPTLPWIYAGRLLSGICFGVCLVATPVYVVEISPVRIRGFLGSGNHFFFSVGAFVMITLGYGLRWSWLAVSGAAVTSVGAGLMFLMPESPEWLYRNARIPEAIASLRFFKGKHIIPEDELKILSESMGPPPKGSWRHLADPAFYKPAFIAVCLIFFQKFSGINIINSYIVQIFQNTGSKIDAQTCAVVVAAVNMASIVVGSMFMDKLGRRALFIASGSVLTAALTVLGIYEWLLEANYDLSKWSWVPLLCLIVYISFYAVGVGPIPLIMIPELVPISSRSTLLALSLTCGSLLGFTVTKSFAFIVAHIQYHGMFLMFGACSLLGTLFGVFCIPETKGKTISEISSSFSKAK